MSVSGRRYYSPSQGRFLGRDPQQEKGGLNLFGFCRNDSINQWDYLGMTPGVLTGSIGFFSGSGAAGGAAGLAAAGTVAAGVVVFGAGYAAGTAIDNATGLSTWVAGVIVGPVYVSRPPQIGDQSGPLVAAIQNPPRGEPGSISTVYNPDGTPKQVRQYGPDGYPQTDIDYGHGHELGSDGKPIGEPHVHDWTPDPEGGFPDRGGNRPPRPEDPKPTPPKKDVADSLLSVTPNSLLIDGLGVAPLIPDGGLN
jgi:hypothetical protein